MELVARQRDRPVLDRARVQQVHEHALALLHSNRFTRAQRFVVDRVEHRAHFQAVGTRIENRWSFRLRPFLIRVVGVHELSGEERFPVAQREKDLLIVVAGILPRLDDEEPELPGVAAPVQVGHGHRVSVIPARPGRPRRELIPAAAMRRHRRRALLVRAIGVRPNEHAVPVDLLRHIGVVHHFHGDRHTLAHPQQRTR